MINVYNFQELKRFDDGHLLRLGLPMPAPTPLPNPTASLFALFY